MSLGKNVYFVNYKIIDPQNILSAKYFNGYDKGKMTSNLEFRPKEKFPVKIRPGSCQMGMDRILCGVVRRMLKKIGRDGVYSDFK